MVILSNGIFLIEHAKTIPNQNKFIYILMVIALRKMRSVAESHKLFNGRKDDVYRW